MLPADVMYSDNRPYSISTSSCSGNITGRKKKFFVFCFKEGKGERKKKLNIILRSRSRDFF